MRPWAFFESIQAVHRLFCLALQSRTSALSVSNWWFAPLVSLLIPFCAPLMYWPMRLLILAAMMSDRSFFVVLRQVSRWMGLSCIAALYSTTSGIIFMFLLIGLLQYLVWSYGWNRYLAAPPPDWIQVASSAQAVSTCIQDKSFWLRFWTVWEGGHTLAIFGQSVVQQSGYLLVREQWNIASTGHSPCYI